VFRHWDARMRDSIEASCGACEDVSTLLVGQVSQAGEHQLVERAEIAGQTLDGEVAPNHAPLWAENFEEFARHTTHGPFVARIAEPAERR